MNLDSDVIAILFFLPTHFSTMATDSGSGMWADNCFMSLMSFVNEYFVSAVHNTEIYIYIYYIHP